MNDLLRHRPRVGTLFFVGLVGAFVVAVLSLGAQTVISTLYGPIGGLILVVMVVEYLVLKSMDRTRVYQLENTRLRKRNRNLAQRLKETRALLKETPEPDSPDRTSPDWRRRARELYDDMSEDG